MSTNQYSPRLRDLRLRPTRLGISLAAMIALLWLVGLNYQVNLAYIVAFWLAGFLFVGTLLNCLQLLGLRLDLTLPEELFQGQPADIQLFPAPSIKARYRQLWFAPESRRNTEPEYRAALFTAKQPQPFIWPVLPARRGRLILPPLRCASVWPFAVSSVECVWHWPDNGLVYPAPQPHTAPPGSTPAEEGEPRRKLGGNEDLAFLQEHQPGTSLQHIAWKSYAKSGRLLDKHFEEPAFHAADHIISYADYPAGTSADRLAGLLCYRVLEAHGRGQRYTLILPGQTIPPQNGQREKCLAALAVM